jgi:hypothetical protein
MNRRAVAVVLALIIVGAGTILFLSPRSSTSFHFEDVYPEGDRYPVYLWLTDIQDCALNLSFVDNSDLLYQIDVELYDSQPAPSAFDLTIEDFRVQSSWIEVSFHALLSFKSLQITLGSGVPYMIVVTGSDVNATFVYDNNAIGSGASIDYSITGSFVSLSLTEDMVFSTTGMEVSISEPDYAYLSLDLPDGVNGLATFREPLSIHSNNGWSYRSTFIDRVSYATDPWDSQPLIEVGISSLYRVHAWLSD